VSDELGTAVPHSARRLPDDGSLLRLKVSRYADAAKE
jgi:hypothetical protein